MTTRWQDLTSEQRDAFTQVFDAHLLYGELTAETPPLAEPGIGFADLYAAATDPAAAIDDRLRRALAAAPRLRQDFARIVQRTARWHGPRLAAAEAVRRAVLLQQVLGAGHSGRDSQRGEHREGGERRPNHAANRDGEGSHGVHGSLPLNHAPGRPFATPSDAAP